MVAPTAEYLALVAQPQRDLRRFMLGGKPPVADELIRREYRGTNMPATSPWTASNWRGKPRFGYFTVTPVDPLARDNRYPNALLLDYGSELNEPRDPTAILRDYLVRTESGPLLGHAFFAIGPLRIPVGFFALEPM